MKRVGVVSYNIYGNFTNYGSALQSWALHKTIRKMGHIPVLVDYCPEVLKDKDILNPMKEMWDKDEESQKNISFLMSAIKENYYKFEDFYTNQFSRTRKYTRENFYKIIEDEQLKGFVCGSDTIFCIDEFNGFDDGYYANYDCMKRKSVAYAASFGDSHFDNDSYAILNDRLQNFKAIGLREENMLDYCKEHVSVPIQRTIDPTLLLTPNEYDTIVGEDTMKDKYLLLYSRRWNPIMQNYAEKMAKDRGLKIVEISIRGTNADKGHLMRYNAGVQEFLSLVKNADYVITNSFHGVIFSVQMKRPFTVFSREQCDNKIEEVLELFGLKDRMMIYGNEKLNDYIDYDIVHDRIAVAREESMAFLNNELEML